jgi:hypothetical protein
MLRLYYELTQLYSMSEEHRRFVKVQLSPLEGMVELTNGIRIQRNNIWWDVFFCHQSNKYEVFHCRLDQKKLVITDLGTMHLPDIKRLPDYERIL